MEKSSGERNHQCDQAKKIFGVTTDEAFSKKKKIKVDCDDPSLNIGIDRFSRDLEAYVYKADVGTTLPRGSSAWIIQWHDGGRHAFIQDHEVGGVIFGFDPLPVGVGTYFMIQKDAAAANTEFTTEEYYSSIHKS
jgi:hypothetical protein